MDLNGDGLINFEEFVAWLYGPRPSTEKQLVRRAMGILEREGGAKGLERPWQPVATAPVLGRMSSEALREKAARCTAQLRGADLEALREDESVKGLWEVVSLLLAGLVAGGAGPLEGVEALLERPFYFLAACEQVLAWIEEGKLPEENVESARAVHQALGLQPAMWEASPTAQSLCDWVPSTAFGSPKRMESAFGGLKRLGAGGLRLLRRARELGAVKRSRVLLPRPLRRLKRHAARPHGGCVEPREPPSCLWPGAARDPGHRAGHALGDRRPRGVRHAAAPPGALGEVPGGTAGLRGAQGGGLRGDARGPDLHQPHRGASALIDAQAAEHARGRLVFQGR